MAELQETIRVKEITNQRISMLVGYLAISRGDMVRVAMDELIENRKPELMAIAEALLRGDADAVKVAKEEFYSKLASRQQQGVGEIFE